jgi:hypothetical protein
MPIKLPNNRLHRIADKPRLPVMPSVEAVEKVPKQILG